MRMSWSKLWQRNGGKRKQTAQAPASGPVPVTLAWVSPDGQPCCEQVSLTKRLSSGGEVKLRHAIEPNTPVWLISDEGFERLGSIASCDRVEDRFVGRINYVSGEPQTKASPAGTRIKWLDADGKAVESPASLAAAGEGQLRLSLARAVPAATIIRIAGHEYQCLASTVSCEQQGEAWIAEADLISPAFKRRQPQAA